MLDVIICDDIDDMWNMEEFSEEDRTKDAAVSVDGTILSSMLKLWNSLNKPEMNYQYSKS